MSVMSKVNSLAWKFLAKPVLLVLVGYGLLLYVAWALSSPANSFIAAIIQAVVLLLGGYLRSRFSEVPSKEK